MTDPDTGLPADNIPESLAPGDRSGYTSPTNIGGYMWSTVVARELGIISAADARARLLRTLTTLEGMEHHEPSGMYYNWYDEATGDPVLIWPENGNTVHPFVSSVDNGWLGAALLVVKNSDAVAGPLAAEIFARSGGTPSTTRGTASAGTRWCVPAVSCTVASTSSTTTAPAASTGARTSAGAMSGSRRTTTTRSSPRRASRATSAS